MYSSNMFRKTLLVEYISLTMAFEYFVSNMFRSKIFPSNIIRGSLNCDIVDQGCHEAKKRLRNTALTEQWLENADLQIYSISDPTIVNEMFPTLI